MAEFLNLTEVDALFPAALSKNFDAEFQDILRWRYLINPDDGFLNCIFLLDNRLMLIGTWSTEKQQWQYEIQVYASLV